MRRTCIDFSFPLSVYSSYGNPTYIAFWGTISSTLSPYALGAPALTWGCKMWPGPQSIRPLSFLMTYFYIQYDNLSLLIRLHKSFTFIVLINMVQFKSISGSNVSVLSHCSIFIFPAFFCEIEYSFWFSFCFL